MMQKTASTAVSPPQIFDRKLYALRRARARGTTFLVRDAAAQLAERSGAFGRAFERGLDLSSRDQSFAELRSAATYWTRTVPAAAAPLGDEKMVTTDEEALPFGDQSFDLIT